MIFNAASGDLHLLNPAAIRILDRLTAGPASFDELCASLENPDVAALSAVLQSLDRLGLVSPLAS